MHILFAMLFAAMPFRDSAAPPIFNGSWQLLSAAMIGAVLFTSPALATSECKFDGRQAYSVKGPVLKVSRANDFVVIETGYRTEVAIEDEKRSCIAYVQTSRAPGCAKGRTATAKGRTFVVGFTSIVLPGADSVKCR